MAFPSCITVINPNSLESVTKAIDRAVDPFRSLPLEIACLTSVDGPDGIQTQMEADQAIGPLIGIAKKMLEHSDVFVVACFSDPGLHSLRESVPVPVLGIGESAMLTAMSIAQRIGIIAIASSSVPRHIRYFRGMGVSDRICGERALDMRVAETSDTEATFKRTLSVAQRLRDEDGADVLVLGCAGMADLRQRLEDAVERPVVEPTQAAIGMALGRIALR